MPAAAVDETDLIEARGAPDRDEEEPVREEEEEEAEVEEGASAAADAGGVSKLKFMSSSVNE